MSESEKIRFRPMTPYRRLDPDLLIISRKELEGMRMSYSMSSENQEGREYHNALINQLLERIGK